MDRSMYPVKKSRLEDQGRERDLEGTTPAERIEMVWALTIEAWAFMGQPVEGFRVRRDVERVIRRGC